MAAWLAVERRHCTSARCGHCSACASDQMLRRIIPTAERTVTRGGNKTIDKGDAISAAAPGLPEAVSFELRRDGGLISCA